MQANKRRINALGKVLLLVLLLGTMASGTTTASPSEVAGGEPPDQRPNVLLVITDDQRSGRRATPDTNRRIVRKGTRFTNAYATTPACCPSRASIFTGQYSHNHGVIDNGSADELSPRSTVAYYLKKNGYRTGLFGKYLNRWWNTSRHSEPRFFGMSAVIKGGHNSYYRGAEWNINGVIRVIDEYSTTFIQRMAHRALRKWERKRDPKPWFLVTSVTAPHGPFTTLRKYRHVPVPEYVPETEKDKSDKPTYVQNAHVSPEKGTRRQVKERRALLPVDDLVDEVLADLRSKDELENTLIIFISDNAVMWGEHGLLYKSFPYTEDIQVPFYMRWDGHTFPGTVDDRFVGNIDVTPTILEAAGVDESVWGSMDGNSLLDATWERDRIHLEYLGASKVSGAWASTRTRDYQYTEYYNELGETQFREYYDLLTDPLQMVNLYEDGDPLNNPPTFLLESQLDSDVQCEGESCP